MDKLKQQIKTYYDSIEPSGQFMERLAATKAPAHKNRGYLIAVAAMLALMIGGAFLWQQVRTPQAIKPAPVTMQQPVQPAPGKPAAPAEKPVPSKPAEVRPAPAEPKQEPEAPKQEPVSKPAAPAPSIPAPAEPASPDPDVSEPAEPVPEDPPEIDDPSKTDDPSETDDPTETTDPDEQLPRADLHATYEGGIVTLTNGAGEQATIDVSEQFRQRTYYGVFTVFGEQVDIFLYPDESSETAVLAGYLDEPSQNKELIE